MRLILLILVALVAAVPATAQQQGGFEWKQGGATAPPTPAQASRNGFGVFMLVTPDLDGFWEAWARPSPPQIGTTDEVRRGRPVYAILLFSGCRPAPDGNCNVTAELSMTGPNGSPYGDTMRGLVWAGPPAPQYRLQASESSLGFRLEPADPLGTYTLRAMVTDNVAGTTLSVEQPVRAVAGE
jgi:hypothetical protein